MRSYVVSVYRLSKDRPHELVGVVEEPGNNEPRAFRDIDELWAILAPAGPDRSQSAVVPEGNQAGSGSRD